MDLNEAKELLKNKGFLVEKTALQLDTEEIDNAIANLQKHREMIMPIAKEVGEFLPAKGIQPTEFGIGKNDSGRFVLWIVMPKNRFCYIAVYDDGLEINVDGEYTIDTTKDEYLPKLLKAIKKLK